MEHLYRENQEKTELDILRDLGRSFDQMKSILEDNLAKIEKRLQKMEHKVERLTDPFENIPRKVVEILKTDEYFLDISRQELVHKRTGERVSLGIF